MQILYIVVLLVLFSVISFIIGRYSIKYDGAFIVDDRDVETTEWILEVKTDPEKIKNKKNVRLKVKKISKGSV